MFKSAKELIMFNTFWQQKISVGSNILWYVCVIPELADCNSGTFCANLLMFCIFILNSVKSFSFSSCKRKVILLHGRCSLIVGNDPQESRIKNMYFAQCLANIYSMFLQCIYIQYIYKYKYILNTFNIHIKQIYKDMNSIFSKLNNKNP